MSENEDDFMPYDDEEAIKFIQNQIPQELKEKFNVDDLYYIVDLIYEYYEKNGFMDQDDESEVEIDLDVLTAYVVKLAKKDKVGVFTDDEIRFVIDAEIAYCDSIGVFE